MNILSKKTILLFSFFSIFLIVPKVNAFSYNWNFDDCNNGDTLYQCVGMNNDSGTSTISNVQYVSSPNSLKDSSSYSSFFPSDNVVSDFYLSFDLKDHFNNVKGTSIGIGYQTFQINYQGNGLFQYYNSGWHDLCTMTITNWNNISIRRINNVITASCNGGEYVDISNAYSNLEIDYLQMNLGNNQYLDNFYYADVPKPPDQLEITNPYNGQYITTGDYQMDGTCLTNGTNQLIQTWQEYNCESISPNSFNILCSGNQFHVSTTIYQGNREIFVYDRECNIANVYYTGINPDYDYKTWIIYPTPNNSGNFFSNLAYDDNYQFRFGYELPSWDFASSTKFSLGKCTSDYSSCNILIDNTLSIVDEDEFGFIDSDDVISSSTMTYYQVNLTTLEDVVLYSFNFRILGSADDNAIESTDPDVEKYGYFQNIARSIFVPKPSTLHLFTEELPSKLEVNIPFSYFYLVKNRFDAISISTTTISAINVPLNIGGTGTITIPVLDFNNSIITDTMDFLRPFIIAFLWGGFLLWLIRRITNFDV